MIFAMSDIHGNYEALLKRIEDLNDLSSVKRGEDKLIFLGDYIDRGSKSFQVLEKIYEIQQECGKENVIVLKGNHEVWFLDFLENNTHDWLGEDGKLVTTRTFLNEDELQQLGFIVMNHGITEGYDYVKNVFKTKHREIFEWLKDLPYYYKTDTQIFVHAGIDEELNEWWEQATSIENFIGKYPPTFEHFYMDIIAGHTAIHDMVRGTKKGDVVFDGKSHYYIDGCALAKKVISVLVYDEERKKYYSLGENTDGDIKNHFRDVVKRTKQNRK